MNRGFGVGCLKSIEWGGGGVISHLRLIGGEYGWYVDQTSQWVMRSARLEQQRKHSLWLNHVWNYRRHEVVHGLSGLSLASQLILNAAERKRTELDSRQVGVEFTQQTDG